MVGYFIFRAFLCTVDYTNSSQDNPSDVIIFLAETTKESINTVWRKLGDLQDAHVVFIISFKATSTHELRERMLGRNTMCQLSYPILYQTD